MDEQTSTANPRPAARSFQFSLRDLFFTLLILSMFFASIYWFGVGGPFMVLFFGSIVVGLRMKSSMMAFYGLLASLAAAAIFVPIFANVAWQSHARCSFNLQTLGFALHNYHERHGCFPPAYLVDKSGVPTHSWRVLLLGYVNEQPLRDRYDFAEPWNGPNNRRLSSSCPDLYRCPNDPMADGGCATSYLAITGPGTAWPGSTSAELGDLPDQSNTILIVEVAGAPVHWMEPRDLVVTKLNPVINSMTSTGISSKHKGGANVLMADGTVKFLSNDMLPAEVHALLAPATKDGGK